jgi:serine/threonine protein kinase
LENILKQASEACVSFVRDLLTFDPTRRMTAAGAIAHPYLAHLGDPAGEASAPKPFSWDFDNFEPTKRNLKDRVYAECARFHPEILQRDAEWLASRGVGGTPASASASPPVRKVVEAKVVAEPVGAPPARMPRWRGEKVSTAGI